MLGQRTANILKHLFPVLKADTKRIITFSNEQDYISFRHHIYDKPGGPKSIELKEIGPRFELKLFKRSNRSWQKKEQREEEDEDRSNRKKINWEQEEPTGSETETSSEQNYPRQ
ncbi:putative anticodon-binding, Brix domain-containing protein [Rosa chinensis]|uniref:Putative anticodon-binding, Brix domain-containing protein n=1 Tax=Rosa chinensis TaxID=74649 RepID=A0A2P6S8W0_ROSCH|nr:putative anticodon-binding, Brix domain-containing protein [Rosa chinensis]